LAPADALIARLPVSALGRPDSTYTCRQASAAEILDAIQEAGSREALKPVYELPSFVWLIAQAASVRSFGELRLLSVHSPDGARCGWCVYWVKAGHPAYVLQIGVRRREHVDGVLLALFHDAWEQGACAVKGQAIPSFLPNLTAQHCFFSYPRPAVLVQSSNAELLQAIHSGNAALSRLDGEWWMRFAVEDWQ
jgi:hypothetical protein